MALVCDTGPLLAALDSSDPDHRRCAALLEDYGEDLVVPSLVLAEVDYWCHERLGVRAWLVFLEDVLGGAYRLEHPSQDELRRCHELQQRYADLRLGIVDASVLALVERLREPKIATLDHRHFATVRPAHVSALLLVP